MVVAKKTTRTIPIHHPIILILLINQCFTQCFERCFQLILTCEPTTSPLKSSSDAKVIIPDKTTKCCTIFLCSNMR